MGMDLESINLSLPSLRVRARMRGWGAFKAGERGETQAQRTMSAILLTHMRQRRRGVVGGSGAAARSEDAAARGAPV